MTTLAQRETVRVLPGFLRPRAGQIGAVVGRDDMQWAGAFHGIGDAMTINVRFPDGAVLAFGPAELEAVA